MFYHDEEKQRIYLTFGNIVRTLNDSVYRIPTGKPRKRVYAVYQVLNLPALRLLLRVPKFSVFSIIDCLILSDGATYCLRQIIFGGKAFTFLPFLTGQSRVSRFLMVVQTFTIH